MESEIRILNLNIGVIVGGIVFVLIVFVIVRILGVLYRW